MEILSKMGGGGGKGGGADMLGVIQDIQDNLRKEFDDKLNSLRDDLLNKIKELENSDNLQ